MTTAETILTIARPPLGLAGPLAGMTLGGRNWFTNRQK